MRQYKWQEFHIRIGSIKNCKEAFLSYSNYARIDFKTYRDNPKGAGNKLISLYLLGQWCFGFKILEHSSTISIRTKEWVVEERGWRNCIFWPSYSSNFETCGILFQKTRVTRNYYTSIFVFYDCNKALKSRWFNGGNKENETIEKNRWRQTISLLRIHICGNSKLFHDFSLKKKTGKGRREKVGKIIFFQNFTRKTCRAKFFHQFF